MLLPQKIGIGGAAVFGASIMIGWVATPLILKMQVHSLTCLSKKGEMRENWSNLPFPWITKFYLFNITNPDEIEKGEKPIIQQVGPYVYDEWRKKVDLVDRDEDDTLLFRNHDTWHFNASRSNGLTGDEELIFPHPAILSIVMFTAATKPTGMGVTSKAIDSIFKKPKSLFVRVKAREILFDGLPIDCTVKDFAGSAVCSVLRSQEENFVVVEPNKYKVSMFGHTNGTATRATRILRGVKKSVETGRVVEYDNQTIQEVWSGDQCNMFNGTEGTIFHPWFSKDEDLVSFAPGICRSLSMPYKEKSKAYDLKTHRFVFSLGDQSTDPNEKCFCVTPETCLKKGAMNLLPCMGTPIVLTMPHFYNAHPSYLDTVSGLNPTEEEHEMYVDIEPMTGTPLQFRIAFQFNMFVHPIDKFKPMKTFPEALLPLFWLDRGIEFSDEIISELKSAYLMITIFSCFKWMMFFGGLGLMGAGGGLEYKRRMAEGKLEVTAVSAAALAVDNVKNSSGDVQKWAANVPATESVVVPPTVDRN